MPHVQACQSCAWTKLHRVYQVSSHLLRFFEYFFLIGIQVDVAFLTLKCAFVGVLPDPFSFAVCLLY